MGGSGGGPQPPLGTPEEVEAPVRTAPSLPPILGAVPPLQAEILDNEIKELQAALHEAKSRNLYLSGIVEQQKRYTKHQVSNKMSEFEGDLMISRGK